MRTTTVRLTALAVIAVGLHHAGSAQAPERGRGAAQAGQPAAARGRGTPPQPVFKLEDNFLDWRLLPAEKKFESIDGKRMLGYVNDLAAMSRRYRDSGHPQFWGRIIGTSADHESAEWLMNKFRQMSLHPKETTFAWSERNRAYTERVLIDQDHWFPGEAAALFDSTRAFVESRSMRLRR